MIARTSIFAVGIGLVLGTAFVRWTATEIVFHMEAGDFIFNCQMGRGRTTTGMVTACLISTTMNWQGEENDFEGQEDPSSIEYDSIDGPSEEQAYLQGLIPVEPK